MDVGAFVERHRAAVTTAAGLAPLIACAVLSGFRESVTSATSVLVLVLLIVAAASTGIRAAGIEARRIDVDRSGFPTDEYTALVVARGDLTIGHFLLTAASTVARPSLEQRKVAVLLADQAGSVLGNPTL